MIDMAKIKVNAPNQCDGLELMQALADEMLSAVVFDPQYQGVLKHQKYGSTERQKGRFALTQMSDEDIEVWFDEIERLLKPSGHLFLWVDKYNLYRTHEIRNTLHRVDMLVWDKQKMGMGYRLRQQCEFLLVYQKAPKRAKDVWLDKGIRDIDSTAIGKKSHPHQKPVHIIQTLIRACVPDGEWVGDFCAGSYSTLKACFPQIEGETGRQFIGCDLELPAEPIERGYPVLPRVEQ